MGAVFLPSAFYRKPANHKNGILALRLLDGAWKAVLDEGLEEAVRPVPRVLLALFHWFLGLHASGPMKRVLLTYC